MFIFSTVVLAKEYLLNEIEVSINIPNGWYVFTENSNYEDFSALDKNIFDFCMKFFEENPVVRLYAFSPDFSTEILITCNEKTDKTNYNSIPNAELEALANTFETEFNNRGLPVSQCTVYYGTNTKYIKALYSHPNDGIYTIQYSTATTDNAINITLNSYEDIITDDDEKIAKSVADSLTGLSEELFEATDIESRSNTVFDFNEMLYNAAVAGIAGVILGGAGFLFHKRRKEGTDNIEKGDAECKIQEEVKETLINNFCRVCGAKLSNDSSFCHKCGTKILEKGETNNDLS